MRKHDRDIDEEWAAGAVTRAELYLIASKLKRMATALTAATMETNSSNTVGAYADLREANSIAQELEPLLQKLVYGAEEIGDGD